MDDAFVLDQFRDEFDPETLKVLARAFDLSWRYLQRVLTDPTESDRERLAEIVMQIGRSGELKTIRIANRAVDSFSEESPRRLRSARVEKPQSELESPVQLQGGA
jgi:hypothetical protein